MTDGTTSGMAIDPHEERILETAAARPELTVAEIAEQTGHIIPTVRDTLNAHGDAIDEESQPAAGSKPTDSASFNATEQAVLEAALRNPEATNKEIAARVDTHVGLVRDIRETYEEAATLPDGHDGQRAASTADSDDADRDELSETQHAILEVAADSAERTYADIAEQTGARLPLVRDTLETYDPDDVIAGATSDTAESTAELSESQQRIIEHAAANPTQTYAEIAAATDSRLPLVRDTLEAHGDTSA